MIPPSLIHVGLPVESLQRHADCKGIPPPSFCLIAGFFAEKRNTFARFLKKAPCTSRAFWNPVCEVKQPKHFNH
jgi:hypothetical protein